MSGSYDKDGWKENVNKKCDSTEVVMEADTQTECRETGEAAALAMQYSKAFCLSFNKGTSNCTISADGETDHTGGNSGWMTLRGWLDMTEAQFDGNPPSPPPGGF